MPGAVARTTTRTFVFAFLRRSFFPARVSLTMNVAVPARTVWFALPICTLPTNAATRRRVPSTATWMRPLSPGVTFRALIAGTGVESGARGARR